MTLSKRFLIEVTFNSPKAFRCNGPDGSGLPAIPLYRKVRVVGKLRVPG